MSSSRTRPPQDASFQLRLPEPNPSQDEASTVQTRLFADTDPGSGLQPVFDPNTLPIPVHSSESGPVHAHPRTGKLRSLRQLGEVTLKELSQAQGEPEVHASTRRIVGREKLTIVRHKREVEVTWSLSAQLALLVHFSSSEGYAGAIDKGALYLSEYLFLHTALFFGDNAAPRQFYAGQGPGPRLVYSKYVSFELPRPELQVLEIFSTIGKIQQTVNFNESRLSVEFLRLYFVDVLNQPSLEQCHIDWSTNIWFALRKNEATRHAFADTISTIARMTAHDMEMVARETEEWMRSLIKLKLNSSSLSWRTVEIDNSKLPLRAIAFRILRVCVSVQNTMVEVWKVCGDPRGNAKLWQLTRWENVVDNIEQPIVLESDDAEHDANLRQRLLDQTPSLAPFQPGRRGDN